MKVALVCDWLTEIGGAERLLKTISDIYPDAPIYTSQYRKKRIDWFKGRKVVTGWLNFFPAKMRKMLGPLRQLYFSRLDLSDFDVIISITGAEAKAIKQGSATHFCFCHVPTQYYWHLYDYYLKHPGLGFLNPLFRLGLKIFIKPLRKADYHSAQNPDFFISISQYSAAQIQKYYHRDSVIIHPPVDIKKFTTPTISSSPNNPKHFINFSRQVNWKRLDLAVRACLKTGSKLTLIGDGPEHKNLQRFAKSSKLITFLPKMTQKELNQQLKTADGYIFPSLEPFGIAPIEAMSAGCPVIAYGEGGARDFITTKNGLLFEKQTVSSLVSAIEKFNSKKFNPKIISETAQTFSKEAFKIKFQKFITEHQHVKK